MIQRLLTVLYLTTQASRMDAAMIVEHECEPPRPAGTRRERRCREEQRNRLLVAHCLRSGGCVAPFCSLKSFRWFPNETQADTSPLVWALRTELFAGASPYAAGFRALRVRGALATTLRHSCTVGKFRLEKATNAKPCR